MPAEVVYSYRLQRREHARRNSFLALCNRRICVDILTGEVHFPEAPEYYHDVERIEHDKGTCT